ncbi:Toluene efflux pump outer membrane protein TtgF precursor [Marinomonas aquimarina]|uniref:Toluene efflux pump outer membrane protein TtgF n=1 Tax=Marinomonas aquimarina TaxID=295068 RepID=A0A1A8T5S8_9GAMM|nr:TolC family protein [Marinomonas aquimarina]SBS26613.1 Toluene efflux pump outer membrane protein TtgF precursor [Marinomonas aquimarina]
MPRSRFFSVFITASATAALVGCSTTATEQTHFYEEADALLNTENQRVFSPSTSQAENASLTDLIPDSSLQGLVHTALSGNPSLQKTALSLAASQLNLSNARAARLPQANLGLSASDSETGDGQFSGNANISWELDLWARLADAQNAAEKSVASDYELFRASQASLAGNVMKSWLQLIAHQRAIDIEQQRLALLETNESLIIKRFRNGLGTLESLDEAKTATSQSRADLAQYHEDLASELRALRLLLGDNQAAPIAIPEGYPNVLLTLQRLPNQDLALRPDLRAAYLSIEAADYEVSVAYKDMLPSFDLSASLSDASSSLRDALFVSPVWSLLGQLSTPVFQGGRLRANHEIAKLNMAQAYQDYRETLLNAVNEVEDAIGQEAVLNKRQQHINSALQSAESNRQQYERKYRSGLVELSDLISAQQAVFNLQSELDTLQFQQLSNRIELGLALGLGIPQA